MSRGERLDLVQLAQRQRMQQMGRSYVCVLLVAAVVPALAPHRDHLQQTGYCGDDLLHEVVAVRMPHQGTLCVSTPLQPATHSNRIDRIAHAKFRRGTCG